MPDVEVDFGAGLEVPVAPPVVAAVTPPVPDEFMTQFRGLVDGLPEDFTRDKLADHLVELQTRAERAAELERQNAEYQAQLAVVQRKAEPVQEVAPVVDEFALPWKPVKVDQQYRSMVAVDSENGGYRAKNPTNPVHIAAANEMNQRAIYEAQFSEDLLDDPESVVATLSKRELAKLRKEYDEKFKALEERFQPIQQATEQAKEDAAMQAFVAANQAKLFATPDTYTPLGSQVDALLRTGKFTAQEALAFAESVQQAVPASQVAPPPKPTVLSKPSRVVDDIAGRMRKASQVPPNQVAYDGSKGKWRKSWEDVDESVRIMHEV